MLSEVGLIFFEASIEEPGFFECYEDPLILGLILEVLVNEGKVKRTVLFEHLKQLD